MQTYIVICKFVIYQYVCTSNSLGYVHAFGVACHKSGHSAQNYKISDSHFHHGLQINRR